MKTRGMTCIGLAAALACAAAAAQAAIAPLRLCADPANLPFSSNAPEAVEKAAPGLYVEIGQALARALGRPMETVWSLSYFGKRNLRTTLLAGQCDLAIGLPAVSDFMGPRVIFTRSFLTLGYALVVPKSLPATGVDDLKGKRVAVQFASPPQSLLAMRNDITSVTTLDPEEAMRRLAAGEADAAFIWAASAGYINRFVLHDRFNVIPVEAPQMQWQAAIGLSNKQAGLRDEVDAALGRLEPRIRDLTAKYGMTAGPALVLADASPMPVQVAANDVADTPPPSHSEAGNPAEGKEVFNGTCGHCHGPDAIVADRKINLRRLKEKYSEQIDEVFFTTVQNGRPSKGMPAWKEVFKQQDFVNILAYLKTVQEK